MRRVTFDTNIFVSAFQFGGLVRSVLQMMLDGEIEVAISEPIIQETLRVLQDKFTWSPERLHFAETVINAFTIKVQPAQFLNVVPDDVEDNRILECAVESGSEAIVTGDKHLLRMGSYEGIRIIRAGELWGGTAQGDPER